MIGLLGTLFSCASMNLPMAMQFTIAGLTTSIGFGVLGVIRDNRRNREAMEQMHAEWARLDL